MYGAPEEELNRLEIYYDLAGGGMQLLEPRRLVPSEADSGEGFAVGGEEIVLMMLGRSFQLSNEDLIMFEGLNRRAKAYFDLANNCGLHLHPYYLALPHQLGSIHHHNSIAFKLYRQILEHLGSKELQEDDDRVGRTAFDRTAIPALSELLLARCRDSPAAIGPEILKLRQEHKQFRGYISLTFAVAGIFGRKSGRSRR